MAVQKKEETQEEHINTDVEKTGETGKWLERAANSEIIWERLTEEIFNPDISWKYKLELEKDFMLATGRDGRFLYGKAVNKLAEYENAEENRLLFRLPCRLGDFLFAPTRGFVSIFQVIGFEYSGYDVFVKWKLCKGITGRFQIDGIYKSEIGKAVFLTKIEAEMKLKEHDQRKETERC